MPIFTEVGPEARERLVKKSRGYEQRQVYRDMLGQVGGSTFEVGPEGDETVRHLKGNIRRAANELGLQDIRYGETEDGNLLVWNDTTPRRRGRGRRRQASDEALIPTE